MLPLLQQEIEQGIELYTRLAAGPLKNLTVVTSTNLLHKATAFHRIAMGNQVDVALPHVLHEMMKTGKYYPSAQWIIQARLPVFLACRVHSINRCRV